MGGNQSSTAATTDVASSSAPVIPPAPVYNDPYQDASAELVEVLRASLALLDECKSCPKWYIEKLPRYLEGNPTPIPLLLQLVKYAKDRESYFQCEIRLIGEIVNHFPNVLVGENSFTARLAQHEPTRHGLMRGICDTISRDREILQLPATPIPRFRDYAPQSGILDLYNALILSEADLRPALFGGLLSAYLQPVSGSSDARALHAIKTRCRPIMTAEETMQYFADALFASPIFPETELRALLVETAAYVDAIRDTELYKCGRWVETLHNRLPLYFKRGHPVVIEALQLEIALPTSFQHLAKAWTIYLHLPQRAVQYPPHHGVEVQRLAVRLLRWRTDQPLAKGTMRRICDINYYEHLRTLSGVAIITTLLRRSPYASVRSECVAFLLSMLESPKTVQTTMPWGHGINVEGMLTNLRGKPGIRLVPLLLETLITAANELARDSTGDDAAVTPAERATNTFVLASLVQNSLQVLTMLAAAQMDINGAKVVPLLTHPDRNTRLGARRLLDEIAFQLWHDRISGRRHNRLRRWSPVSHARWPGDFRAIVRCLMQLHNVEGSLWSGLPEELVHAVLCALGRDHGLVIVSIQPAPPALEPAL